MVIARENHLGVEGLAQRGNLTLNRAMALISWGILGAGAIARAFATDLPRSRTGRLAAVGSRERIKAEAFAAEFAGVPDHPPIRAHGSYEELLADPGVEALYIATPHPSHAEWCLRAARAGKHILCEKPLTMNHAEAVAVAAAAGEAGVFLMEAFMYRCHPLTARLVQLIREGALGEVGAIQATFSFRSPFRRESRLFDKALGGGGILDVGCYAASIARLVAGAAVGRSFADFKSLAGSGMLHPETGADLYALASGRFAGGIVAQLATGVGLTQDNGLRVFGTEASLHIPSPFVIAREGGEGRIFVQRPDLPIEEIVVAGEKPLYAYEADAVGDALAKGERESPCMPVADSLGNMAALDAWRAAIGLVYAGEPVTVPAAKFP